MSTATLWAIADWGCSPSQVTRCLERSRGAPISVKYFSRRDYLGDEYMSRPTEWFGNLISEHSARWQDIRWVADSPKELKPLAKSAAPQLRRLVVDCGFHTHENYSDPLHLFEGNAPNLRVVELSRFFIHWEWAPSMIANLRSLVLRGVRISEDSVGSFFSTILSSSMLEKLVIWYPRFDGLVNVPPVSPTWLHSLKEIEIIGTFETAFRYFLGTIRAPNIRNAKVDYPYRMGTEDWGPLLLRCLDNSILQHVEQALHIELYFRFGAVRVSLFKIRDLLCVWNFVMTFAGILTLIQSCGCWKIFWDTTNGRPLASDY
ncbi:hypothetical protein FS837_004326 [Tulasnella sp. UAMH 9824]|nr:hypothetical protein FS837_004326 [Tulasnella sp. UAMH 9824]